MGYHGPNIDCDTPGRVRQADHVRTSGYDHKL
jgi:hypothetical protein